MNTHVSDDEQRTIWDAYLELGSYSAVAKQLKRDRETISRQVNVPAFEKYRESLHTAAATEALSILKQSAGKASKHWVTASEIAADKGDHKPAKELLQAIGVIQADQGSTHNLTIGVMVGMPDQPALPDPFLTGNSVGELGAEPALIPRDFESVKPLTVEERGIPQEALR